VPKLRQNSSKYRWTKTSLTNKQPGCLSACLSVCLFILPCINLSIHLSNDLIPRSMFVLETLLVSLVVGKFPKIYGTQLFTTTSKKLTVLAPILNQTNLVFCARFYFDIFQTRCMLFCAFYCLPTSSSSIKSPKYFSATNMSTVPYSRECS